MFTEFPSAYHSGEDIHQQSDRDEASLETAVRPIRNPDLIASRDLKGFEAIDPRLPTFTRSRDLTRPLDGNREVLGFHQASNPAMSDAVSLSHPQRCDASIPVRWITPTQRLYFFPEPHLRWIAFRVIIEKVPVETQRFTKCSHGIICPQRFKAFSFLRRGAFNPVNAFFGMSSATVNRPTRCSRWAIRWSRGLADPWQQTQIPHFQATVPPL